MTTSDEVCVQVRPGGPSAKTFHRAGASPNHQNGKENSMVDPPTATNYVAQALARLNELCPGLPPELARYYTLLILVRGAETSFGDVHDAWALWRNDTRPDHPALIPYYRLDHAVQALDAPFVRAIRRAVADLAAARAAALGEPDTEPGAGR